MAAQVNIPNIIKKKRDGCELSTEEIQAFITAVVDETAEPAQIGAWLMAVFLQGMTQREAIDLTKCMMMSGEVLKWPEQWKDLMVDKHSTGGVGDKVSLVLAPALAACGMKVPMISGRGLEHTGGTLDKLEAIPGYSVDISAKHMHEVLSTVGCCIVGQTGQLVPADRILYKTRDVTATVDNLQLITGSIVSKKAAEGIKCLVLDVKTGNGAFMETQDLAEKLAKQMVEVGCGLGIKTSALITSMDCPLGQAVGHALEVAESVHCLQGKGPADLTDLVVETGGTTLHMAGKAKTREDGCEMMRQVIKDHSALAKFQDMAVAQGASEADAKSLCDVGSDVWKVLKPAAYKTSLKCPQGGVIESIKAMDCARAVQNLGAGRSRAGEAIDLTVGLYLLKTAGDEVSEGTPWVEVHHSTPEIPDIVQNYLSKALVIVPNLKAPIPKSRVLKVIEPTQT